MSTVINDDTGKLGSVHTDADGNLKVTVVSGGGGGGGGGDASAANQVTQTTKLTSIDGKTPALGQALAAASTPVVLTALQVTALTPPAAITGFATAANQAAEIALLPTPLDSIGNPLPADFEYLAVAYNYTGSDLTTVVKTKGGNTFTKTFGYTSHVLVSESKWVKV